MLSSRWCSCRKRHVQPRGRLARAMAERGAHVGAGMGAGVDVQTVGSLSCDDLVSACEDERAALQGGVGTLRPLPRRGATPFVPSGCGLSVRSCAAVTCPSSASECRAAASGNSRDASRQDTSRRPAKIH
mgnify:CR=1 FL=1